MGDAVASFSGHLGHLTAEQTEAFNEFRKLLSKASPPLYKPASETSEASTDDITLIRFLRARKFDPAAAVKQFSATESWRKAHDVDNLFATFPTEELEESRRYYPRWTGRRDKMGFPVFVFRIASLLPLEKELNKVNHSRRYQRIIVLHEHMIRFIFPLCSSLQETPVSSVTTIIDLEDISLGAMWRLRNHLQEASKLATANYPESLHATVIVNAPGFFGTVWGWIKGWFDEGTRSKIHVLSTPTVNTQGDKPPENPGATTSTLLSIMDVSSLPRIYGGTLDFRFEDEPNLDPEVRAALKLGDGEGMVRGPRVWKG